MKKPYLMIIIFCLLLFCKSKVYANEVYKDFAYNESETFIEIVAYNGNDSEVNIPEKINGKNVTKIADYTFLLCNSVEKIIVPKTVEEISEKAFLGANNLKEIICFSENIDLENTMSDTEVTIQTEVLNREETNRSEPMVEDEPLVLDEQEENSVNTQPETVVNNDNAETELKDKVQSNKIDDTVAGMELDMQETDSADEENGIVGEKIKVEEEDGETSNNIIEENVELEEDGEISNSIVEPESDDKKQSNEVNNISPEESDDIVEKEDAEGSNNIIEENVELEEEGEISNNITKEELVEDEKEERKKEVPFVIGSVVCLLSVAMIIYNRQKR